MKTHQVILAAVAVSGIFVYSARSQAPAAPVISTNGQPATIPAMDGITMSGKEVLVSRDGGTEKLVKEIQLTNGARVSPDGTVVTMAGEKTMLQMNQVLTFDGRLITVSAKAAAIAPVGGNTAVPSPTAQSSAAAPMNQATPDPKMMSPRPMMNGTMPTKAGQSSQR